MRNKNTNPGIEKRGSSWCARYYDANGNRRSKNFKNKSEALSFKREQERLASQGIWTDPKDESLTVAELVEIWRKSKSNLSQKTWATYESQLQKYILPAFGSKIARNLRPSVISEWMKSEVETGAGHISINRTLALLSQIFEYALLDGRVHRNPVKGVKRITIKKTKMRVEVIDPEQLKRLIAECTPYSELVLCAGLTGMRWGELTALRVSDIDFERNTIIVSKANSTDVSGALIETSTKTGQVREIPLVERLKLALALLATDKEPDDYLFSGSRGGVLNYEWFMKRIWKPAVKRLGLDSFGFHGLRRTCASLMISQNAPITAVSSILGHTSVRTTLEAYAHFYEDDKSMYLEKIAGSF